MPWLQSIQSTPRTPSVLWSWSTCHDAIRTDPALSFDQRVDRIGSDPEGPPVIQVTHRPLPLRPMPVLSLVGGEPLRICVTPPLDSLDFRGGICVILALLRRQISCLGVAPVAISHASRTVEVVE